MDSHRYVLPDWRIKLLRAQGFHTTCARSLTDMAFGIRFAYRVCVLLLLVAMATKSVLIFSFMVVFAFGGIILPNHPFDYIYNYTFRLWMGKPILPRRSKQLKFACKIATPWLGTMTYLLSIGMTSISMVLAGMFVVIALLPSTIDLCLPSLIYNMLYPLTK